jgi:hypothetical protein
MVAGYCSILVKGSSRNEIHAQNISSYVLGVFTILFYFYTNICLIPIHSELVADRRLLRSSRTQH